MADREHIPAAKKAVYLDKQMLATIMCMIPAGKLTTQEAICEMWAKRRGRIPVRLKMAALCPLTSRCFGRPPIFSV